MLSKPYMVESDTGLSTKRLFILFYCGECDSLANAFHIGLGKNFPAARTCANGNLLGRDL
jgi:hypothetical protein